MPTIIGSKSGTRPYLELDWSVSSQDIANNRSRVNLRLFLRVEYDIKYSARYTGTLQGASFTSSSGYISSPGRYLLTERNVWITHNSDGTKTQRLTADYNLNITWGGSYRGNITLSGDANLGTIPRASTLSAFSFASHFKPSTAVTINYTVDRKSGNFRHQIEIRDGSYVVQSWDNISSNGSSALTLSTSSVNDLLNRMSNVTSRSLTLRVRTRSGVGGGWIGSAVTRTATATVDSSVKPVVGELTIGQTGNTVSSHFLQSISRVYGFFTGSEGFGATMTSSSITVRRKTTENDVQTINSDSGTTDKTVSLTGLYQARGTARDSRGRTAHTSWVEFTVTPYESPKITNFTAERRTATPTTVDISRAGTHTPLGGSNVLTYSVQRRIGTGSWSNVNTNPSGTSTSSSFSGTSRSTSNSVTTSYDFRMVITDMFGESAESIVSVSTQRVVLDIHKNEGVGVGKIHERGVLDVDGDAYYDGDLFVNNVNVSNAQNLRYYLDATNKTASDTISFWQNLPQGTYFITPGILPNQPSRYGVINHTTQGVGSSISDFNTIWYTQDSGTIYRKSGNGNTNNDWRPVDEGVRGSSNNGQWIRFNDGTQICWGFYNDSIAIDFSGTDRGVHGSNWRRSGSKRVTFPKEFIDDYPVVVGNRNSPDAKSINVIVTMFTRSSASFTFFLSTEANVTVSDGITWMAVGRWK